jgi:predicted anti-sigma-YlaC factor YlaD
VTNFINCQTAQELIPASMLDALEVDEELTLLAHLRECATCRAEADALRPVASSLGFSAADAGRPAPQVKLNVMSQIGKVPKPQTAPLQQRRWVFRPIAALVPAAIALILIFGLGAAVVALQTQATQQQARLDRVTQQQVALRQFMLDQNMQPVAVKLEGPATNAQAVLYASNDTVAMAVTGLPKLEGDAVYQCWWVDTQTGEVTPGTTFKVDANGAGVWAWKMPEGNEYGKMQITKEPRSGQTKAAGPVLITAEF